MRRTATLLAVLLASTVLTSCQVAPGTGKSNFNIMSAEEEQKMGAEAHPDVLKEFGGTYDDPQVQAYVAGVGKRLLSHTETPAATFRFTVLNSHIVNAFALPGGYVYVTRGLLALADDEAELAGVVGHEIGHVTGRHTAQRYSQAMAANVATGVLGAVLGAVTGVSGLGDIAQLGAAAYIQGYSRENESEADELGIRYMTTSGWNPDGMTTFLSKLRDQSRLDAVLAGRSPDEVDEASLFASHPRTIDRVRDAANLAKGADHSGAIGREQYLAHVEGLLVGDDPDEGVVRGRVFSHAGLGIRYEVPAGFRLVNGPKAVMATHKDGSAIRFDMGAEAHGDMTNYLQSQWAKGARLSSIEALEINGLAAATGVTRLNTNKGAMDARLLAVKNGKSTYRFLYLTPPGVTNAHAQEFKTSGLSLRKLSEAEKSAMKPLRLKIITARAGDTVEKLAEQLPYEDHKVERFRLLNGLAENQPLKPGQKLKMVI
ncbi:putative Zn-dependent protease [Paramagnetospirillum magnetotacticum MS-1]|uniref:Putative Zn-dependent protease n=1 Tax=Paramagnetospirillum magnetotacticum MS-1 TaxID=272627 RepID=A0A0C2YST4_PARME|nr:M48 family metalloprotease [Paramagnetospirillum magnetotacticum]KIL98193.1 putative Zn-dependent protease [Paramagnetospirillum magnetotacticum MS-1]